MGDRLSLVRLVRHAPEAVLYKYDNSLVQSAKLATNAILKPKTM